MYYCERYRSANPTQLLKRLGRFFVGKSVEKSRNLDNILVISARFFPSADTIAPVLYRYMQNIPFTQATVLSKSFDKESMFPEWLTDSIAKQMQLNPLHYPATNSAPTPWIIGLVTRISRMIYFQLRNLQQIFSGRYDILLTNTLPPYMHWYGIIAKFFLRDKIFWVSSFSDPYSNSPYEGSGNKIQKWIRRVEERIVFKLADRIIYLSETQREFCYKGKSKDQQTLVIPVYFLSDWQEKIRNNIRFKGLYQRDNKNKHILVHTGNIYGNRRPQELFRALKNFTGDVVQLHNCGKMDERLIDEHGVGNMVVSHGHVDYEQMLEFVNESDYFVVLDSFFDHTKNPYMPSKVVDAMYFDKPIIAITDKDTELHKFCQITGNVSVENEAKKIAQIFQRIISKELAIVPDYTMYKDLRFQIVPERPTKK